MMFRIMIVDTPTTWLETKKKFVKFDDNLFSSIKFEDDKIKDINSKVWFRYKANN